VWIVKSPDAPRFDPTIPEQQQTLRETAASWDFAARLATIGIFLIMTGAVLIFARAVLLPVVAAIVIGTMLGPLDRRAREYHIPSWLFAAVVIGVVVGLLQLAIALLSGSILEWIKSAPEITDMLKAKLAIFDRSFTSLRNIESALAANNQDPLLRFDVAAMVQATLGFLTPAMGELLVFLATLFFFLFSRSGLRRNLILVFEAQDTRLRVIRILNDIELNLTRYLGTVTVINFAIGLIAGVGAALLGLPNPILIGTLAFVCNYVPYIGPAFVVLVLFCVALIHYPLLGQAVIPPALFVALTTLEGHIITPNVVGQRLTLNPFAVFLGLTVWTWIWGPVGAFLSVPFVIVGIVITNHLVDKDEVDLPG
jgi:predicted PurR-regulated permease PerM